MVTTAQYGKRVTDGYRVGILVYIDPDWLDPEVPPAERKRTPTAWVQPVGGGREWTARPAYLVPL
ncbi:hypothetical protein [Streptomyces sp. NPDC046939]|uniref:hypothetical protein n=1 Tax=Streptomyces sp. NPDC046939 TaxID=3155376 RepID=UPI00340DE9D6